VNVPPALSGYATDGDRTIWKIYDDKLKEVYGDFFKELNDWVQEHGGPTLNFNFPFLMKYSPYANIYMYPIELDYTSLRPNPPNWHQFDAFVRNGNETFEIPEKLRSGPGKLIYFSLGTIGCVDVELMKRLIKILGKSPNRFIVSKGKALDNFLQFILNR